MKATFNLELNSKKKADGTFNILLRITRNKKHKRISSPVCVLTKNDFNKKAKYGRWIRTNDPDYAIKNETLLTELEKAKKAYNEAATKDVNPSFRQVVQQYQGSESTNLFEYAQTHIEGLDKAGKYRTHRNYTHVIKTLREYVGTDNFTFDDLTVKFLNKYQVHLQSTDIHQNTVFSHFKNIRALVNKAIQEDQFEQGNNPFFKFKSKEIETEKERLDKDEMRSIKNLDLENGSLIWNVRNAFMFSFYCAGIRCGDLLQLRWNNIDAGKLTYTMDKTGKKRILPLSMPVKELLGFYHNDDLKGNEYILPFLDNGVAYLNDKQLLRRIEAKNALLNKYLKKIAKLAGIKKNLSMHISRHSFANIARQEGKSVYDVSKALGHSKLAVTARYMDSFDEDAVSNAMDAVVNL